MLAITYSCQANCLHCGVHRYWKNNVHELTYEEIADLLKQSARMGIKNIYYFGGEPLIRKDFIDLVRLTGRLGMNVRFDTNALLFDAELARNLKESANIFLVGVSLDSHKPEEHDRNRGVPGAFQAVMNAIEYCKAEGLPVNISAYVTKENIKNGGLESIINLGKEMGVNGIRVLTPILCGRLIESRGMDFTSEEQKQLQSLLEPGFAFLEHNDPNEEFNRCLSVTRGFIYISSYGEVQPCCYVPVMFGNIRDESLEKILKRMWAHPLYRTNGGMCLTNSPEFRKLINGENTRNLPLDINDLS